MKKLSLILAVIVASVGLAVPSHAIGLRVGPRVGVNVNNLHFDKEVFDKENRTGFTGGLELNLSLPLGFGIDASVMYARRAVDGSFTLGNKQTIDGKNLDYISVPINLEWGISLPLINKIVVPYVYVGPDFAFKVSKDDISQAWNDHKVDVAMDFGIGLQFIKHLRVSATYGMGLTKWANWAGVTSTSEDLTARTSCWTITAAWLF